MGRKGGTLLLHEGGILSRWNFPSRFSFSGSDELLYSYKILSSYLGIILTLAR